MANFKKISRNNWEVRGKYKDTQGNTKEHKKRGFTTKKEAEEYINKFLDEKERRRLDIEGAITFSELLQEFHEFKKYGLKKNTLDKYTFFINLITENLGNIFINDLTEKQLLTFLKKYDNRPFQQDRLRKFMKMSLDYGVIYCNLPYNIMNKIKLNNKKEKKKTDIWTYEEFKKFVELLDEYSFRNEDYRERAKLFYQLMYYSGARPGEISGLQKKDIDVANSLIDIKRTRINNNFSNSPKTPESNRKVSIPTWLSKNVKEFSKSLYGNDTDYIFPPITVFQNILIDMIDKFNLKHITLHGLRHSHVSLLINKGVDIATISKRIGHANPNITLQTYTHLYDTENKILSFLEEM